MAGTGKYKLSDAIPQPQPAPGIDKGGKPVPTHETAAEQIREAEERAKAKNAEVRTATAWWTSGGGTNWLADRAREIATERIPPGE